MIFYMPSLALRLTLRDQKKTITLLKSIDIRHLVARNKINKGGFYR